MLLQLNFFYDYLFRYLYRITRYAYGFFFFFYGGGDTKSVFILWIFLGGGCMGIGVPFEKCSPAVPRLNFFQISRQLSVFSRDLID